MPMSLKIDELDKKENINVYHTFLFTSVYIVRIYYVFNFPLYFLAYICENTENRMKSKKITYYLKKNTITIILTASKTPKIVTKVALFNKKFYSI